MKRLEVVSPLKEALEAMLGEKAPAFLEGVFSTDELTEPQVEKLQNWCCYFARPHWSTGIAIMEAADRIVSEAVGNANICPKDKLGRQ